jgi:uncharacterized protein
MKIEELKRVVVDQNENKKINLYKRELMDKVEDFKKTPFIIIISGIRRSGKSSLMEIIKKKYENFYYLNFDDERLINFKIEDFEKLYDIFFEIYGESKLFFFDEIQLINGWERFVRRLHNERKKVYITGSNATMLSYELGTHLTGRNIQIELFPFSFKEFVVYKGLKLKKNEIHLREKRTKIRKLFNEYLKYGGFFEYFSTKQEDYLKNLYNNILFRDVISRHNLVNKEKILKELVHFLFSNISKEFSYTSLAKLLGLSNAITVKEYLKYFENSYLLFSISKFDYSLKKQLINPKKIYAIDSGLANIISFKFSEDMGRILENIVFLELRRKGLEIYYYRSKDNSECDFIIRTGINITQAIQVTKSIEYEKTRVREIKGLVEAMKEHKLKTGLILTENEEDEFEIDKFKIVVKPIWKWILTKD